MEPVEVTVTEERELDALHDPRVNVVHWVRHEARERVARVAGLAALDLRLRETLAAEARAEQVRGAWSGAIDDAYGWLAEDIALLARRFGRLIGAREVDASLARVRSDSCRRFHVDRVTARLLCTYAGPGTVWLPERAVDRGALARFEPSERCVRDETAARHASAGDVVLLKGELWPENQGRGAVHRSPALEREGLSRLLLTLDAHSHGESCARAEEPAYSWRTFAVRV